MKHKTITRKSHLDLNQNIGHLNTDVRQITLEEEHVFLFSMVPVNSDLRLQYGGS